MNLEDASKNANAAVRRWIAAEFRKTGRNKHLRDCPDLSLSEVDGDDGSYGCDTGCEYARLEAVVSCPHGERERFTYGEFGELADIIERIEAA